MRLAPTHLTPFNDKELRENAIRLATRHDADELAMMIGLPRLDQAAAAIIALGINGEPPHAALLVGLLRDNRAQLAKYAEDAIWSIWMRSGSAEGNARLAVAIGQIRDGDYTGALNSLSELIQDEPSFAEAHHQRGVAAALLDRYELAAECYTTTLTLNRVHFGAMAGLGNVAAALEDWDGALRAYQTAIKINPHMDGIFEAIELIEAARERQDAPKSTT